MSKLETQLAPLAIGIPKSAQNSMRETLGRQNSSYEPLSNIRLAMEQTGYRSEILGGKMENKGWSQQDAGS